MSWCIGHLVSSAYPQDYDEKYKAWKIEDLPTVPDQWKYSVSKDKQKQFNVLKKLMNDKDVTEIINACDSGREGELIFRLAYNQVSCNKPFKRLWTSSLENKAILEGMQNLKYGADFDNLYRAADCRDKADWLVGMNLSRLFSIVYHGKLAVGRVKTPTLAMIADRDTAIRLFKKETNFAVSLELDGFSVSSEKFATEQDAMELAERCKDKTATVKSVIAEAKTTQPPKLYDLTTLQRECNRLFKYTAQQTLTIAQVLYESKLITYPRTDSKYLTEDMKDTALAVIQDLQTLNLFAEDVKLNYEPNIDRLLDNSKVSDHYAIIPTRKIATAELHALPQEQQQVLALIAGKLLCAVSAPYEYEITKITVDCKGTEFTVTGTQIIDGGFKELERIVQKRKEKETPQQATLPNLKENDCFPVKQAAVTSHDTSPPKTYTEDTLLSAMERAGQLEAAHNPDYIGDTPIKCGLGTPATRAATIEGLVKDGYITRLKNQIQASKLGLNLISVVPEEIQSAKLTADWEEKLQAMERGEYAANSFMQEIESLITALISKYTAMQSTVDTSLFQTEREVVGVCPRCGTSILYGAKHKNYYCDNKDCKFALWENNKLFASMGKKITKAMVQDFLAKGETEVKGFVSKKTGKPFDCTVVMKDTGKYINFDLKFTK